MDFFIYFMQYYTEMYKRYDFFFNGAVLHLFAKVMCMTDVHSYKCYEIVRARTTLTDKAKERIKLTSKQVLN